MSFFKKSWIASVIALTACLSFAQGNRLEFGQDISELDGTCVSVSPRGLVGVSDDNKFFLFTITGKRLATYQLDDGFWVSSFDFLPDGRAAVNGLTLDGGQLKGRLFIADPKDLDMLGWGLDASLDDPFVTRFQDIHTVGARVFAAFLDRHPQDGSRKRYLREISLEPAINGVAFHYDTGPIHERLYAKYPDDERDKLELMFGEEFLAILPGQSDVYYVNEVNRSIVKVVEQNDGFVATGKITFDVPNYVQPSLTKATDSYGLYGFTKIAGFFGVSPTRFLLVFENPAHSETARYHLGGQLIDARSGKTIGEPIFLLEERLFAGVFRGQIILLRAEKGGGRPTGYFLETIPLAR